MHMFLLQSHNKVISLRDLSVLRSMKVTNYKLTYFCNSHGSGYQSAMKHPSTLKDSDYTSNSESKRLRVSVPGSISSTTSRSAGNRVELELTGPSNNAAVDHQGHIDAEGHPAGVEGQTEGLSAVSSHRQVTLTSICTQLFDHLLKTGLTLQHCWPSRSSVPQ